MGINDFRDNLKKAIKKSGVLFFPEAHGNLRNGWRLPPILTGVPELDVKLEPYN